MNMSRSEMTPKPNSLASYCIANIGRSYNGLSAGCPELPKDPPSEKRACREYRDGEGNVCKKAAIAKMLGVSISSVGRIYDDYDFDHKAIFDHYLNKSLNTNIFRFDNGEVTQAKILGEHYGVHRGVVSAAYTKFNNDYLLANAQILASSLKKKEKQLAK